MITNNETLIAQAEERLREVFDPEIGLNVLDLGLIYEVIFQEEEKAIEVEMTLTTRFCPMGESIVGDVEHALAESFPGYHVAINLTFEPPWNIDLISDEGRQFLNR